jgi:predicted component of type VI protein secretion system
MNYLNNVLDDFKDGTDGERLDLYLHHRNLRSDFDQIEDEKTTLQKPELTDSQKVVIKPGRAYEQPSLLGRMKHWCLSVIS